MEKDLDDLSIEVISLGESLQMMKWAGACTDPCPENRGGIDGRPRTGDESRGCAP